MRRLSIILPLALASCIAEPTKDSATAAESATGEISLEARYQAMLPRTRGTLEPEILAVAKRGLLIGRQQGRYKDVSLEDLMAHARQEGNTLINALETGSPPLSKLKAIGTNLWDIHMQPSNDLLGNISWSIWQTISNNYLRFGKDFDPILKKYYEDHILKYGLTVPPDQATELDIARATYNYRKKMKEQLGEAKAAELLDQELAAIKSVVSVKPELHVLVTAALIQANYDDLGAHSPNGIRAYFWLDYQKNLVPSAWLGRVDAADLNVRGDYGKQVMLGNASNDRGMFFWYAVTGDRTTLDAIKAAWATDPAALTKADYSLLQSKGYLQYAATAPALYADVRALLP
jgi:hypothetical protein